MVNAVRVKTQILRGLDPSAGAMDSTDSARREAARNASLDGAVIAVVDNGFNPAFARSMISALGAHFKLADILHVVKDNVSVPPRHPDWERIKARATAGIALYGG